ncbi:MAG TPA: sigma factor, partial [Chloroflexota bacterium]|nr:sigma factor [Chloroflexota bacterium]
MAQTPSHEAAGGWADQADGAAAQTARAPFSDDERGRVLGLCVRLTGDLDAAEDLAQETLFEAWRAEHRLREPHKRWPWIAGIARNVCRRWARQRGKELARLAQEHDRASDGDDGTHSPL